MQLESTFRRRRISLTSLIDVIFLLLLFFMLSSTFSSYSDLELFGAGTGGRSSESRPAFLQLKSDLIRLNGRAVEASDLERALLSLKNEHDINALVFSVGADASAQDLVDTMVILRSVDGLAIQIIQ